jgi:predicted transcriptional regulator
MSAAWTPEEDRLLRSMAAAGESAAAIGMLLKRTASSVRNRARLLKIKTVRSRPGPKGPRS